MGAADVVPGVSGGTVALIVGIYSRLVGALASFDKTWLGLVREKRFAEAARHIDLYFLLTLLAGIATSILAFSKIILWCIAERPIPTWSLFLGLVLGSMAHVLKLIDRWSAWAVAAFVAGTVFAYWLCGLLPAEASHGLLTIFLSGAVAICAMILPGISGSFVLVVLGQYVFVLEALHRRDLAIVFVFCAGCATGLLSFSKLLRYMLREHGPATMAALCGLMLGSLRKVWPFKVEGPGQEFLPAKHRVLVNVVPDSFTSDAGWALAMAVLGVAIVLLVEWLAAHKPHKA